jgi:hypothetical protein
MWTGMKRWFRKHFFTEWQHVGLFERTMRYKFKDWTLYIHCYESQHGDRVLEVIGAMELDNSAATYDKSDFESKFEISPLYQKELYPWLKGRENSNIPGFEFVKTKKFDFTRKLKDKDTVVLDIDEKA